MLREVNLKDISDGKTYRNNDVARIDTQNCIGCCKCCTNMGQSIVLDPFDVARIKTYKNESFNVLLENEEIELNIVDGLVLPNIKMTKEGRCSYLDKEGRCTIHINRPGICRLFPLGRIYNEDSFVYFNQNMECEHNQKTKIKIKKWINVINIDEYDKFILDWHRLIRNTGDKVINLKKTGHGEKVNDIAMYILNEFYVRDEASEIKDYFLKITENDDSENKKDIAKKIYKDFRRKILIAKNAISRM